MELTFRLLSLGSGETEDEEETEQDRRVKASNESDPVTCVALRTFVFTQLDFLQSQLGQNFERLLATVNSDVRQQLMEFKV